MGSVRYATVRLERPMESSHGGRAFDGAGGLSERRGSTPGIEPVDWLLDQRAGGQLREACVIAGYYQQRWVIEERHRMPEEVTA